MSGILTKIFIQSRAIQTIRNIPQISKYTLQLYSPKSPFVTSAIISSASRARTSFLFNRNQLIDTSKLKRSYVRLFNGNNNQALQNKTNPNVNTKPPSETPNANATAAETPQKTLKEAEMSLFAKFKDAYKKHGKVLIITHVILSCGWAVGFYALAQSGFDIGKMFNLIEKIHIISHETTVSIMNKIETFDLEKFLRSYHFDYVFSDATLVSLGKMFDGITLKHLITTYLLYKIFTPLRYLATLGGTKLCIDLLKRRGVIPQRPPPGSSIKELYEEQKQVIRTYGNRKALKATAKGTRLFKRTGGVPLTIKLFKRKEIKKKI